MKPESIHVAAEVRKDQKAQGYFYVDDCVRRLEALREGWSGRVKLIYMDPPYLTGDRFYMRLRVGEKAWKAGRGTLPVPSFADPKDRTAYLEMMRRVLAACRELLSEDGMIFVHIDYRLNPHLRLLLDELFGEDNFLNEIIWVYQTGGRSVRHFSRKHDVILFYRKSDRYDFNIDAVKAVPAVPRDNHMKRHVDEDGRTYRSIRVGGRLYTYYDDEPVAPSDVWADLSHLQQKDPERTGYDTQKPLSLLNRVVNCASRPGEWVLDPFSGSGTTLEAAVKGGRNFIGIDSQPMTANIVRRRLKDASMELWGREPEGEAPECQVSVYPGVGFYHVVLERFEAEIPGMKREAPMDEVDNWSVGYLRGENYEVMESFARTRRTPALQTELRAPVFQGQLALCVADVLGRSWYYKL